MHKGHSHYSILFPHTPAPASMGARRVSHQRKCATVCCNLIPVSATSGSLYTPKLCLSYSFLAWVSNCVPVSCYFCSWSTGWGTYSWGWSIGRGGAKDKTESQGFCNQRRATEISLCSFTSGKLNLWNQHDKSCPLGISEWTTSAPTTETGLVLAAVEVEGKYTWELVQIEVRADPTLPTVHPETYLKLLEDLLGRWVLVVTLTAEVSGK